MTGLEIVMVSVTSLLIFLIVMRVLIKVYFLRFRQNKAKDFTFLNQYVEEERVVLVGDSLTDFYNVNDFFVDLPLYNRGIAGETTSDIKTRSDEIIKSNPKMIFLQIGINDMIRKKITAGKLTERIIELIKIFAPIPLSLISLYPINRKKMLFSFVLCRHAKNEKIVATNRLLKEYCYNNGITFIDVFEHLIDSKGNLKNEYTIEGLHINIKGYEQISMVLKKYFEKYK